MEPWEKLKKGAKDLLREACGILQKIPAEELVGSVRKRDD
jgi:hypothetical protein